MSETTTEALVEETKTLIAEVESGETAHAAWLAIQDRVKRLNEGRTQVEVGKLIGRSGDWVGEIVRWEPNDRRPTPFGGDFRATKNRDVVGARSALRDPVKRKAAIEQLAKDDPDVVAAIAKEAIASTADATDVDGIASEAFARGNEIRQGGRSEGKKHRESGALEGWGKVVSRTHSANHQAKECLKEITSLDRLMPDDLRDDALASVQITIATWELVAATLRGESVGDQAEAFLAEHE